VLEACIDASGMDPTQPVIAVAGWVSSSSRWRAFEQQWSPFLHQYDLPRWHHTEFLTYVKKDKGGTKGRWAEAHWLQARRKLCDIIGEVHPIGVGAAVYVADYRDVRAAGKWGLPEDAYYFCLDRCLTELIHQITEIQGDEGIAIYCDSDRQPALGKALAEWHAQRYSPRFPGTPLKRKVSLTYTRDVDYTPIQAADVLVNEMYRYMKKKTGNIQLGAAPPEGDPKAGWIIDRLKKSCALLPKLYTKRYLELDLDPKGIIDGPPRRY